MVTEKRLIEANGLLEKVVRIQATEEAPEKKAGQIIMAITNAPVVDAAPVVHGRCEKSVEKDEWYGHIYTCKECEYECMVDDGTGNEVAPNYCPNCGAKMDGERKTDA